MRTTDPSDMELFGERRLVRSMRRYAVKAARPSGEVVTLELEASGATEAMRLAHDQGLDAISARERRRALWVFAARGDRFPLLLFTQELISLLEAGLTVLAALQALHEKERDSVTGQVLGQVLDHLAQGRALSFALEQLPGRFPSIFVATVRASERTGDLKDALARYVRYLEQVELLRRKITSALIYPVVLMLVGLAVMLFLVFYVVPKFSHVYEDLGDKLPVLSRLLMEWGRLLESNAAAALSGLLGAGLIAAFAATRPAVKRWLYERLWRIPAVGERLRLYQLSRFYRTLGMLLRSGTPIVAALGMASGMLSGALRSGFEGAATMIREGASISEAMDANRLATPIALRLLRVGEQSGQMGEMMERIAAFYDDEMTRWIEWATRLFEPLLMAAIGLVIGLIVVLMYLPIFELAGSIQ